MVYDVYLGQVQVLIHVDQLPLEFHYFFVVMMFRVRILLRFTLVVTWKGARGRCPWSPRIRRWQFSNDRWGSRSAVSATSQIRLNGLRVTPQTQFRWTASMKTWKKEPALLTMDIFGGKLTFCSSLEEKWLSLGKYSDWRTDRQPT